MTTKPEDTGCRHRGRLPLGRLCPSPGVSRHLRTRLTQRWIYRWATTRTDAGKLYCPGSLSHHSPPSPLLPTPSQSAHARTAPTCPAHSLHLQQPHPLSAPRLFGNPHNLENPIDLCQGPHLAPAEKWWVRGGTEEMKLGDPQEE